jgi:hypothetical protein
MKLTLLPFAALIAASSLAGTGEIPWRHPSLEMYRGSVTDFAGRVRLELCVRPREGRSGGSASIGYPRYRTAWGGWRDGVIVGIERNRSLRASEETGPACFAVLVPPEAAVVEVPVGDEKLEIAVSGWLDDRRPAPEPPLERAPAPDREPETITEVDDWGPSRDAVPVPPAEPEPEVVAPPAPPTAPMPKISDVDGDLAASLSSRPGALAVIVGVGTYAKAPPATFAAEDAKTAARYFETMLGIPAARIELLVDGEATLGQLQRVFGADGWLARRVSPETEVFIYFAGHGMAELEKFSPYLLPADADPDYLRQTAFSLDSMIEMVASLNARSTTLFLDACFSGLTREGVALLDNARPLLVEQSRRMPAGLSVFSGGSKSQIVSALEDEGHGAFSYHLFKGLAGGADLDHDRRVLASELKTYLEDAVPRAVHPLDREQTPGIVLADPDQVMVQLP